MAVVTVPEVPGELAGASGGAPASPRKDRETEYRITTLDSGVRVVTERMPSVRSVALGFLIGAGSVSE
ncbi:MAG TPA: hypothetical protein VMU55_04280, partial [Solirubrobacteraceae bacterium]|nr:hypothetical protein [Solirubrobacteraceae bacterium]